MGRLCQRDNSMDSGAWGIENQSSLIVKIKKQVLQNNDI